MKQIIVLSRENGDVIAATKDLVAGREWSFWEPYYGQEYGTLTLKRFATPHDHVGDMCAHGTSEQVFPDGDMARHYLWEGSDFLELIAAIENTEDGVDD